MFNIPFIVINEPVMLTKGSVKINDRKYSCNMGAWAFYVPELGLKILHSVEGNVHCTHETAPSRLILQSPDGVELKNKVYTAAEWIHAFSKSTLRRAIENYFAALNLHKNGIGPEVKGICLVKRFNAPYCKDETFTAGIVIDNLNGYVKKNNTEIRELEQANVLPDKSLSCLRQQINGYVSDLNSVVGVMPVGLDHEIEVAYNAINRFAEEAIDSIFDNGAGPAIDQEIIFSKLDLPWISNRQSTKVTLVNKIANSTLSKINALFK
ncbi:MAG: hypothetical protein A2X80_12610 [Geobacteraceae bacterium GWB2_52_12]|nr:MAG: hypothetical protein A2X80_12610 [Geobacteraceae bacterium GWB2_52_12]